MDMFLTLFPSQQQPRLHVRRKEGATQVSIIILYYNPFKKYFTHFKATHPWANASLLPGNI